MERASVQKQIQGEQTRQQILRAAERCFAERGYDATSVMLICEHAGVSKGAFYHHFESKQEVFLKLMQRWLDMLETQLTAFRDQAGTAREGLLSMAGLVGEVLELGAPQLPIYLEFWAQATRDREIWQATIQPFQHYLAFFTEMIAAGMESGDFRAIDAERAARTILSMAIGLLFQGLLDPDGTDWNEATTFGLDLIFNGLVPKEAQ